MSIQDDIVSLSHEFGTADYVQGGGGNSSAKDADTLWVKPSGTTLCGLDRGTLLEMDRHKIAELYDVVPPEDVQAREAMITQMLAAARRDVSATPRPSVESPLHDSFSATFVVHTHPAFVGGMVCSQTAEATCRRLFPDYLYLPAADPGYMISMQMREAIERSRQELGREPDVVFMENHGLVVVGNTCEEVRGLFGHVMTTLGDTYAQAGVATVLAPGPTPGADYVAGIVEQVQTVCGGEHTACAASAGAFGVAAGPLTPDHIVYMKSYPFFGDPTPGTLQEFVDEHGYTPRVVSTDQATVCFGSNENNAQLALDLARDGALITQLAEAWGGTRFMSDAARQFIENWEAETYRQQVAGGSA